MNVRDFGAVADGVTDDRWAIQAAIDQADGRPVYFPPTPNGYRINGPLVARRATHLIGDHRPSYFPDVYRPSYIFAGAGFQGPAMITASGGAAAGGSIEGLALYAGNITNGVLWTGAANDWWIDRVEVFALHPSGYGFGSIGSGTTSNQELNFRDCHVWGGDTNTLRGSAGWVFRDRSYDHTLRGCVAHHLAGDGYLLAGGVRTCASIEFTDCRSEWNGGRGWGLSSGDKVTLRGCTTDRNHGHGLEVAAGVLGRPLVLDGCYFNRDGRTGGCGIRAVDTATVMAFGVIVARGTDDGGPQNPGPRYGLEAVGTGTRVRFGPGQLAGTVGASVGSVGWSGAVRLESSGRLASV